MISWGGTARWTEEGAEPWEQGAGMQPRNLELSFKPESHEDHTVLSLFLPSWVHPSLPFPLSHGRAGSGEEETCGWGTGACTSAERSAKNQVGTMAHRSVGLL